MTDKLKTLKDLKVPYSDITMKLGQSIPVIVEYDILRQEAVKWIKYKETIPDSAVIEWIKHFFNITDEDIEDAEVALLR